MNRKTGRNSREPAENRPTGTFKLTIDEKDLATGSFDAQERRAQPRQELLPTGRM